jgi:hypothetical protein
VYARPPEIECAKDERTTGRTNGEQTAPWAIRFSVVKVKDVAIPQGMERAMARHAEACASCQPGSLGQATRLSIARFIVSTALGLYIVWNVIRSLGEL